MAISDVLVNLRYLFRADQHGTYRILVPFWDSNWNKIKSFMVPKITTEAF